MESGKIKDDQITSSTNEPERQASRGRLNFEVSPGKPASWCSRVRDDYQWLQIDLGSRNRNVSSIATQGGTNYRGKARWVGKYKLMFSDDGMNFHYYKGGEAAAKVSATNEPCPSGCLGFREHCRVARPTGRLSAGILT